MTITVTRLTVSEAATILNAIISFVQHTLGLAIVTILAKIIVSKVHSAITWSVVSRTLHASLWPTLLRADSSHGAAPRVALLSNLGLVSTVLIAVAGVVTPLGLKTGPLVASHNFKPMNAVYVEDTSPLGSATSPRTNYLYARSCGLFGPVPCPGSTDPNATVVTPSMIDMFNTTPYGSFKMQYRQYFRNTFGLNNESFIEGRFSTLNSYILQNDIFAVEGAIVDLTDTPGIGLSNHTMPPSLKYGGTWSQEMLWLEPATTCVDTNLTLDYSYGLPHNFYDIESLRIIDRGGFVNLTNQDPFFYLDGQHVNLYQNAYAGAVYSNLYSMYALGNLTRNQSSIGKAFPLDATSEGIKPGVIGIGGLEFLTTPDFSNVLNTSFDPDVVCTGYGGGDTVNMSNVGVHCGGFLGPPYRTDGGDDRLQDVGSKWRQDLHVCASVTKASIQRVDYSLNGTADLNNLKITRSPINQPVLWAMEKTDMIIRDVAIYWGRVADSYEFNPNLTTIRARDFYIPASSGDIGLYSVPATSAPGVGWSFLYDMTEGFIDYTGLTNVALMKKYQSLISSNSTQGTSRICNLIWTDIIVNILVGTETSAVLMVAEYHPSITFDLKYGIPFFLLVVLWLPSFALALISLAFGKIKLARFKDLLNHTSVGRIVTGHAAFAITKSVHDDEPVMSIPINSKEKDWAEAAGQTLISFKPHAKDPDEENDLLDASETQVVSQGPIQNNSKARC